jgi:mitochondrial fission protein ELM1
MNHRLCTVVGCRLSSPRIWLLTGAKQGDNAQASRLTDAMGLAYERRRIVLKPGFDLAKPRVEASLHHVDLTASDKLEPPWPDLVLTIGRRMAMVALWIKAQSPQTRLALIGPPKREADKFDLIVVPFHYRTEERPNICRIGLPLLGITPERVTAEKERWQARFANLPRPLTVLLCGGNIGSYSLDPKTARAILATIEGVRDGGSLHVVTSRRTPPETVTAMANALPEGAELHRWDTAGSDNPYVGLLAHGDRFIVTGDSVSMLVEVARLGKPLAIAPLRQANRIVTNVLRRLHLPDETAYGIAGGVQRAMDHFLPLIGLEASTRDFALLHDLLYQKGWAVPLGAPFATPTDPPADDTAIAAGRLRALLELHSSKP